jgi:hypothetical protein
MVATSPENARRRAAALGRFGWSIFTICVVQSLVCGLSVLSVLLIWSQIIVFFIESSSAVRWSVFSLAVVPSYVLFALSLMALSALATRITGWRTPADAEMRIADMEWPLLNWMRCMVSTHLVRLFAGTLFRGSPIWTAYLRMAGARLGRHVYVGSLSVSDYNLLEFGDDVVIGGDAHISGHTVEGGIVKTAGVRLGRNVTVGLGSVIDIDVEVGPDCQIGALSLVPKHTKLEAGGVYVGVPVRRIG